MTTETTTELPPAADKTQPIVKSWRFIADEVPPEETLVVLYDGRRGWFGKREWVGDEDDGAGWSYTRADGLIWWTGALWDADTAGDDDYRPTHWSMIPDPRESI